SVLILTSFTVSEPLFPAAGPLLLSFEPIPQPDNTNNINTIIKNVVWCFMYSILLFTILFTLSRYLLHPSSTFHFCFTSIFILFKDEDDPFNVTFQFHHTTKNIQGGNKK